MERPAILHMLTPGRHISPFDINMAADAGYQIVAPYAGVTLDDMGALTQDAIFSRGPKGAARTGIFIGGRDVTLAADMLERARAAMFKPFVVSLFADPSGAFTTAGALLACVEAALRRQHAHGLEGQRVVIVGGTGPVGRVAGVIAAQAGAEVFLASRKRADADEAARETGKRFGVTLNGADASALAEADVLLACATAGVQVVAPEALAAARRLKVAADVNAVPPEGIAGVGVMDDAKPLAGTAAVGIGALVVGNVKYQTQQRLLVRMQQAEKAVLFSFPDAFAAAREFLAETPAQ